MKKLFVCGLMMMAIAGCVSMADRELNEMNRQAGLFIAEISIQDVVAQAGQDVAAVAAQLQQTALPAPTTIVAYSPENVAAKIAESKRTAEAGAFAWNILRAGLGVFGLGGFAELLRRLLKNRQLLSRTRDAYFATVESLKNKIEIADERQLGRYDVKLIAQEIQRDLGLHDEIKQLYEEWKSNAGN